MNEDTLTCQGLQLGLESLTEMGAVVLGFWAQAAEAETQPRDVGRTAWAHGASSWQQKANSAGPLLHPPPGGGGEELRPSWKPLTCKSEQVVLTQDPLLSGRQAILPFDFLYLGR